MLRDGVGTLWATVLAFLTLAFPAQAALGGESKTLWVQTGCALLLGVGFGLRARLRACLRRGIRAALDHADRTADAGFVVMVRTDPQQR